LHVRNFYSFEIGLGSVYFDLLRPNSITLSC